MKEIEQIYHNDFGIAFYWIKEGVTLSDKIQLVFKETGFYFTMAELKLFYSLIENNMSDRACCDDCAMKRNCQKFLLKTPCSQIDLAVSITELKCIKDLIEGALFTIALKEYVFGAGMN